jgi:superfamily II DNA or RNA helicase
VLLAQWHSEASALHCGHVGRLGDGMLDVGPITIATFESGWRRMGALGERFELLVVDEAHHLGRGQKDEILEMSTAPCRLGLTATLPDDPRVLARLSALVGPVVFALGVRDLAGKWLAPFEHVTVELDLTREERQRYERDRAAFRAAFDPFQRACPGASWRDFQREASRTETGRRALAAWRRAARLLAWTKAKADAVGALLAQHRDARVLVFTADNASAYAVARRHLVMPITCDIDRAEREDALRRFAKGELRTLVSSRVLNEGLDVPDADVAIIVGGTLGAREHVQRVGRLLRPSAGKRALIHQLVTRDTVEAAQARRRSRGLAS